jgi:hypothetical protein
MKLSTYQLTLLVLVVVGIANVVAAAFVAMVVMVPAISAAGVYTVVKTVAMAMLIVDVPAVMPVITASSVPHPQIRDVLKHSNLLCLQPSALQKLY